MLENVSFYAFCEIAWRDGSLELLLFLCVLLVAASYLGRYDGLSAKSIALLLKPDSLNHKSEGFFF